MSYYSVMAYLFAEAILCRMCELSRKCLKMMLKQEGELHFVLPFPL